MSIMGILLEMMTESQIELSEGYLSSSTLLSIIIGVVAAALTVTSAFLLKRGKVFAIITGIFQIIGSFCAQKMAHIFMDLDFVITATGETADEAMENLSQLYMDALAGLVPYMFCSMLFMASWVLTLVFIIRSMKLKLKVFPILALIIHILHYLGVSPIAGLNVLNLSGEITEEIQVQTDIQNYAVTLIPIVFVFISALVTSSKSRKDALSSSQSEE